MFKFISKKPLINNKNHVVLHVFKNCSVFTKYKVSFKRLWKHLFPMMGKDGVKLILFRTVKIMIKQ